MKITVKDILSKKGMDVISIKAGSPLLDAVKLMREHKIGAVLVMGNKDSIEGILTERDVLHAVDKFHGNIEKVTVDDMMTRNIIIAIPDDDIQYVMGIMAKNRIRHIPIVSKEKIEGLVSIRDLIQVKLEDVELENRLLSEYFKSG
jgi:CBS domain-containing protein